MSRKQRRVLARILVAAALCIAVWVAPFRGLFRLLAFLLPYMIIGYDVLWTAAKNILHGQVFDEKLLMSIATIGALAIGEYPEAVGVMLFYQVGELFQSVAVGKSRRSIAALMEIRPEFAVVLRGGKEESVEPEEVAVGELIVIRPGEKIPLDGEITAGASTLSTAALTGESLPVDCKAGDKVISGSINLTGLLHVRVESPYSESTVAKILELVENSAEKKAKVEGFITRFARYYTPAVVIGAVLLALIPPLVFGAEWSEWINRALIFLMVSCPCALVVSVPLSFFGGIGGASKKGVLIKGANYLEALSMVDTIVFDKTGTLTLGSFKVNAIHPSCISEAKLLDLAAAAESYSCHPVAESIVVAHNGHIDKSRIGEVEELAGLGVKAVIDGEPYYVGNGALMDRAGADWHDCHLAGTIVHLSRDSEYLGHIVINDEVKADSKAAVSELRRLGIDKTVMLTGDAEKVARAVAEELGIDELRFQLMPVDKVAVVESLLKQGSKLAFVGDGVNDAPVLARADVGIAMGAMGSDAAIEAADIVLMDDKPSKLALAIRIAKKTMGIVRQNIAFALAVKAVILILGACGIANMWTAMFGDVGVMVIAIANAMRAMRI
ncbi:MAG: heavy metal translocating P-type ATPase, partial [Clostridia bacterium]|nr:heavy metal translocating P-type ATPase [Clostridia bacterium]